MPIITCLSESAHESLIGVHCTHGLNRTGYMVCRYMRDRLRIPADEAIKRFEAARGYHIERENYLADLRGKNPPPPDINVPQTTIKPVRHKNDMLYKSPLNDYEEETNEYEDAYSYRSREKVRDRDSRHNNKKEYIKNNKHDGQRNVKYNSNYYYRSEKKERNSNSSSSREFNYAYDY